MEENKKIMPEQEQDQEPAQETQQAINPLDYVTIPIKEYRKMIKKIERMKAKLIESKQVAAITKESDQYHRWWNDERAKTKDLEEQLAKAQRIISEYKSDYEKLLGIDELKKAQLAEMSFEKGVKTDA